MNNDGSVDTDSFIQMNYNTFRKVFNKAHQDFESVTIKDVLIIAHKYGYLCNIPVKVFKETPDNMALICIQNKYNLTYIRCFKIPEIEE